MTTDQSLSASLEDFLAQYGESYVLQRNQNRKFLEAVINPLLAEVNTENFNLRFELMNSESIVYAKNRKEFDVFVNLCNFDALDISIEDGQAPAGFAMVKLQSTGSKNQHTSQRRAFTVTSNSGKTFLSTKLVSGTLLQSIKKILSKGLFPKSQNYKLTVEDFPVDNAVVLKVSERFHEDMFSVNLFPAVPCPGRWACSAHAWQIERHHWPNKSTKEEVFRDGIHLTTKPSPVTSPYHWQIAFFKPRRRLLVENVGCRNKCLDVLKITADNCKTLSGLNEVQIESLMLHMHHKLPVDKFWNNNKFGQRFLDVLKELQSMLETSDLPDFFLPRLNLLRDVQKATKQDCMTQIKDILENPAHFFRSFEICHLNTAL